jgi:alpha-mannosidase
LPVTRREFICAGAALAGAALAKNAAAPAEGRAVYIVPNFHPASCGWLTTFSKERIYCSNSYLDHLDRVRDDPQYAFVLSEVNDMIAIMNFQPQRMEELRKGAREGKVELVNGFFLESTINLSGGEALVRLGIEGLRWQEQVLGLRPRFAWTIDVCGTHDQMAQIAAGLGLEAMVYSRANPTGRTIHWMESPDGTRILALSPGHYSELGQVFSTKEPLSIEQLAEVESFFEQKARITPEGAPILILAGHGDYALAPRRREYPSELIRQWKDFKPQRTIRFATAGTYLDAILPGIRSGRIPVPVWRGGTAYDFHAFWIQNPRVKTWYRRCEHMLQAAEMLATIASARGGYRYPAQSLYRAWLEMFLNMDRNTLWGAAGGMVFEDEKSWDARDRFESAESIAGRTLDEAAAALSGKGSRVALFNALNWRRSDPVVLSLPKEVTIEGASCQQMPEGGVLCRADLPPMGIASHGTRRAAPSTAVKKRCPEWITTRHHRVRVDPGTGALTNLRLEPSGLEVLGAPANVIVAEKPTEQRGDPGDQMQARPERRRIAASSEFPQRVTLSEGTLALVVECAGEFLGGGICRRTVVFYRDYPRIDFITELEDIPDRTVVVAEFPLAQDITEVRRGIPYGFSLGAWTKPNPDLHGWTKGIVPAVRWSHYALAGGGGIALFDRGLTGRELNGRTPIVYLLNAVDKYYGYPNPWLSGRRKHRLEYALLAHADAWKQARVPHIAWEYNSPPVVLPEKSAMRRQSFLSTSDNIIVEAMRRVDRDIELRFVECLGHAGSAEVRLEIPHEMAFVTSLTGANPVRLRGGPAYRVPVRPQQIVTLRFRLPDAIEEPGPLLQWDELVPKSKLDALHAYSDEKGHPPRGN